MAAGFEWSVRAPPAGGARGAWASRGAAARGLWQWCAVVVRGGVARGGCPGRRRSLIGLVDAASGLRGGEGRARRRHMKRTGAGEGGGATYQAAWRRRTW